MSVVRRSLGAPPRVGLRRTFAVGDGLPIPTGHLIHVPLAAADVVHLRDQAAVRTYCVIEAGGEVVHDGECYYVVRDHGQGGVRLDVLVRGGDFGRWWGGRTITLDLPGEPMPPGWRAPADPAG